MRVDAHQAITDQIVAALETGVRPWQQPWTDGNPGGSPSLPLRVTGQPYRGINVLMLWLRQAEAGYTSPYWMTYRQAQEFKAFVRKGEKGTVVVYTDRFTKTVETANGEEERSILFLKSYTVFNADQIEGLPERFRTKSVTVEPQQVPEFFGNLKADIRHGGDRAFYSPQIDFIQMPPSSAFKSAQAYAAILAHETIHWTRAEPRCNRSFGTHRFGNEAYAMEELVAEIGSAFLCADLGLVPEIRDDHAPYMASWLKVLKEDKRAIFTAATHAQRAVEFLHGLQPGEKVLDEDESPS